MDLDTNKEPQPVNVAKEMPPEEKMEMVKLLREFNEVFAWSYEEMWGLDPKLYQYQIHLSKDV